MNIYASRLRYQVAKVWANMDNEYHEVVARNLSREEATAMALERNYEEGRRAIRTCAFIVECVEVL